MYSQFWHRRLESEHDQEIRKLALDKWLSPFVHSHYYVTCLFCCSPIDYSLAVKYPPTCCQNYAERSKLKQVLELSARDNHECF